MVVGIFAVGVVGIVVVVVVGVGNGICNGTGKSTGNTTGGCHSLSSESISSPNWLWSVVGVVDGGVGDFRSGAGGRGVGVRSGGVACVGECLCGAGQPPLFERSDGATTLLEKAAVRGSSIVLRMSEEDRNLPGVGEGIRSGRCDKAQW